MNHSLLLLETRPWMFFIELFRWLVWGTGMLLAPVLQLAIFASSASLNTQGSPTGGKQEDIKPDIEIMPVGIRLFRALFPPSLTVLC